MSAITILTNDPRTLQTSLSTIENIPALLSLLDKSNNTIKLEMSYISAKIIVNYIRGYHDQSYLYRIPMEATSLGLIDKNNEELVMINVGGKFLYVNKKNICLTLKYFEKFFEWNKDLHPDYRQKLIDRCPNIFDSVLSYLTKHNEIFLTKQVVMDLEFYGYDDPNDSIYIKKNKNLSHLNKNEINYEMFAYIYKIISGIMKIESLPEKFIIEEKETNIYYIDISSPYDLIIYLKPSDTKIKDNQIKIIIGNIILDHSYYIFDQINKRLLINITKFEKHFFSEPKVNILSLKLEKNISVKSVYQLIDYETRRRGEYLLSVIRKKDFIPVLVKELDIVETTNIVTIDLNKIIGLKEFYINEISIADNKNMVFNNIEIRMDDKIAAQISKINLLKKNNYYSYKFYDKIFSMKYAISYNENVKIYIYLNNPSKGKLNFKLYGKFKIRYDVTGDKENIIGDDHSSDNGEEE